MATESNSGFQPDEMLGSALHRHALSFQPGVVNSTSEMIPLSNYYGIGSNSGNMMFRDNSNIISISSSSTTTSVNASGSLLLDSVPGLKHDAESTVEWGEEEQYKLEESLVKLKDEPSITKYIEIAATLRDKTVRDVALRCRWMARKRRKQESHLGRKGNYRKDKLVESSSQINLPSTSIQNITAFPHPTNQMDQTQRVKCKVLSSKAKHLLEQNLQAFNQINNNLSTLKLQDNIDIFCRTRDNISNINAILNDMRQFSSKLNQMQELPISIDESLANCILPHTPPIMPLSGVQPKQESRC